MVNPGFLFDLPAAERIENRPDGQFFKQLLVSERQISSFPIGAQLAVILNCEALDSRGTKVVGSQRLR